MSKVPVTETLFNDGKIGRTMQSSQGMSGPSVAGVSRQGTNLLSFLEGFIGSVNPVYPIALAIAGFVMMVMGLILYILEPVSPYTYIFIAGTVMLVIGYATVYLGRISAARAMAVAEEEEDRSGFFYILDEDYSSTIGDATIEDLTRM